MSGFVTENAHAFRYGSPFHIEEHFSLEPHEARMRQIEWNGDARRVVGAEPLGGEPGVGPDPKSPLIELFMKVGEAPFEPAAFNRDLEVLET